MDEYKLYKVYHMGEKKCWNLKVARSPEEALTKCFDYADRVEDLKHSDRCCRAEEVKVEGFTIKVKKNG
ncbi:hypothetical protein GF407_13245 [candidate division KSB1 bacterium]|nr:hypothetical protein [candidate division KSB1 bacterium]